MSLLEPAVLVLVGLVVGAYATAIGAGGGFMITPLLLVRHEDASPAEVTAASLTVVAFSSGLAAFTLWRHGRLDVRLAALLALTTTGPALVGAALTDLVPRRVFAAGVALLLLLLATYLAWRPAAAFVEPVARGWRRETTDRDGNTYAYRVPVRAAIPATAAAGFLSALAGIGGGPFHVPLLTRIARVPHHLAVPIAHVIICALSVAVVGFHVAADHLGEPMEDVPWLTVGVIAGAYPGQWLNRRLGEGPLTRLLAAGLLLIAIRTAISAR
jgi:uncharacterized membrane protein YfcA